MIIKMDFAYFKAVASIVILLALTVCFMNMMSLENTKLLLKSF